MKTEKLLSFMNGQNLSFLFYFSSFKYHNSESVNILTPTHPFRRSFLRFWRWWIRVNNIYTGACFTCLIENKHIQFSKHKCYLRDKGSDYYSVLVPYQRLFGCMQEALYMHRRAVGWYSGCRDRPGKGNIF